MFKLGAERSSTLRFQSIASPSEVIDMIDKAPNVGDLVMIVKATTSNDLGLTARVKTVNSDSDWTVDKDSFSFSGTVHGTAWSNIRSSCEIVSTDLRVLAMSADRKFIVVDVGHLKSGTQRGSGQGFSSRTIGDAVRFALAGGATGYSGAFGPGTYVAKIAIELLPQSSAVKPLQPAGPSADRFPHRCYGCGARCYQGFDVIEHEAPSLCPIGR